VFPGTRHPNLIAIPEMSVHQQAVHLAKELGLLDRYVFFGDWVPYEDWPNYLAESDVALSLHFKTVETRLAFRSRILDYVWARLPMVVTIGDATADLVEQHGLGAVVAYQDPEMLSRALLELLDAPRETFSAAFAEIRESLTWEQAAEPLVAFCHDPRRAADKSAGYLTHLAADELEQEVERLRALVQGYESGRFIRFTKWLHNLRSRG
jgi:hypothetical protein